MKKFYWRMCRMADNLISNCPTSIKRCRAKLKRPRCYFSDAKHQKHCNGWDINELLKSLQLHEFPVESIKNML